MKTATFSNGYTDTYKGKRDVKAAWMVITAKGEILSGHSLDTDKAKKTAENNVRLTVGSIHCPKGPYFYKQVPLLMAKWKYCLEASGVDTSNLNTFNKMQKAVRDYNAKQNADAIAASTIEVITI